jgi:hypothetical protein
LALNNWIYHMKIEIESGQNWVEKSKIGYLELQSKSTWFDQNSLKTNGLGWINIDLTLKNWHWFTSLKSI